jgi:ABC-type microcin C transport system permease subunit YejB
MADIITDFLMGHGKIWAFFASAIIFFFLAGTLFILLCIPLNALGLISWNSVFSGAIGCAIGTSLVNSIVLSIRA